MSSFQLSFRRFWAPILVAFIVILCLGLTIHYWDWLTEDGKDIRSVVIRNSILVAGALVTFVLTIWRSMLAERQLETTQQSHLEGRYQNAAESLHSEVLSIRLGIIPVLDQLAGEHPTQFHIRVIRLFAAFVRYPVKYGETPGEDGSRGGVMVPPTPREDIQIIMDSIALREAEGRELERDSKNVVDLQGADLRKVRFPKHTCLHGVRLSGARLSGIEGLTQRQLDEAEADPDDPPILEDARDRETNVPLEWRGSPIL